MRSSELAINQREVELNANAISKVVTREYLRDRTVDVLVNGVWNFMAVLLQRSKVSELFGEAAEKTSAVGALGLGGGVNGAKVARQSRLGTGG